MMIDPYFLMADDNRGDFELLEEALRMAPPGEALRLIHACDGQQAWDMLQSMHPEGPLPRLVLLDLNLPFIKGADVAARMKSTAHLRLVPTVIISSGGVPREMREHADACFDKPGTWKDFQAFANMLCHTYLPRQLPAAAGAAAE